MKQIQEIFLAAIEIDDLQQRAAYVAQACRDDSALQQKVSALLAAHERSGEFLEVPAMDQIAGIRPQESKVDHDQKCDDEIELSFLQPSSRTDSRGRLLHYEVLDVVGRGGCGIVLKAFDEKLQRIVAIKTMTPELAATSPARKRFLREARATAAIRHENVVSIYAVEEMPLPFLVMEFIDGQTLQDKIHETGPLDIRDVVSLGRQIACGLEAAHTQGLIHRDIKPANILLERRTGRPKITDFGLARSADDASLTQSGAISGTPLYMSPEQAQGLAVDHRSDLFSLGSVLYVMCSGRPPFRAATAVAVLKRVVEEQPRPIQHIIPEVPDWLVAIVAKLHAKQPEERFPSANQLSELLARCHAELLQFGRVELSKDLQARPPLAGESQKTRSSTETQPAFSVASHPGQSSRKWLVVAIMMAALLLSFGAAEATGVINIHGTVIRLLSPEGTLVVEVDDPSISVTLDGDAMVITGAGAKEIRLKPGQHKLRASQDGQVIREELVTVTTGGRQVVRVRKETTPTNQTAAPVVDADRQAAQWVRSIDAGVILNVNGQHIVKPKQLPDGHFWLQGASLFGKQNVDDAGMALLAKCRRLDQINLDGSSATDSMLRHFEGHPAMGGLLFRNSRVTGEALRYFRDCHTIFWIEMFHASVTDADIAPLHLERLERFDLRENPITDKSLEKLTEATRLGYLTLHKTHVTSDGLKHLANCKTLKELWLNETTVDDRAIPAICKLTTLQSLGLRETKVTGDGITTLHKALPKCRIEWNGGVIKPASDAE